MTFIQFDDYDGRTRHVPMHRIVDVREPGRGVHDHGSLRLDTGIEIAFSSVEECRRVVKMLHEGDQGR